MTYADSLLLHVPHALHFSGFCFLMIRRPPRSTLDRSSAASDVYKRQLILIDPPYEDKQDYRRVISALNEGLKRFANGIYAVSYTHLRAHETVLDLVCRLLLEKKKKYHTNTPVDSKLNNIHNISHT